MLLLPVSVFAAGLGRLNINSGIGEPLNANIELLSVTPQELASISATIASEKDYAEQGIERPASHMGIKLQVVKDANGVASLQLKSSQPIAEPYLDMLIKLDWDTGSLLREYTVLLDPPGYHAETNATSTVDQRAQLPVLNQARPRAETRSTSPNTSSAGNTGKINRKNSAKKAISPSETAAINEADDSQEYRTQRGDTLAKIARSMKPEGVSLDQMLIGLYETNPDAFSAHNMHRLKVGQIIKAPTEDTLNGISNQQARQEIKVQTRDWNQYRNKLAGLVADSAPAEAAVDTQSSSGKIKSAAEDKSLPADASSRDVVKLSSGDSSNSANAKSVQDKLNALQEEVDAREKSLQEAQSRTTALEKQIADMQKLLALKNDAMVQAQAQAADAAKPPATDVTKPEENSVQSAQQQQEKSTQSSVNAPATKPPVKAKPANPPPATPMPQANDTPGFFTNLLAATNLPLLAGTGGLVALLAGGWFYLRNKRRKNLADFEQGIMTSGGLKANTVFGNTSGASIDTGDTSFLTDFSQSANGGMIDTNDVDPIAEAEVYMAYGRDAQAEEILKDAISKEPKRYELHLKLLEMYAASKNMSAFETVSGELYTTLGADDPTWAKVAAIGIKLEPNNPLYQVNVNPLGATKTATEPTNPLDVSDFSDSPLAAETDLDFSLDMPKSSEDATKSVDHFSDDSLEFESSAREIEESTGHSNDLVADAIGSTDNHDAIDALAPLTDTTALTSDKADLDFNVDSESQAAADTFSFESMQTTGAGNAFELTMPNLDFPAFEEAQFTPSVHADAASGADIESEPADPLALDIDTLAMDDDEPTAQQETPAMLVDDASTEMVMEEVNTDAMTDNLSVNESQPLDLSNISLELDPQTPNSPAESFVETHPLAIAEDEPVEVETKLELVAAYIDMDDKEGARELLDEVLKEGGITQRKRAEALLAQLA